MPLWLRLILAVLIFFGAAFGAAFWVGTIRWNSMTHQMVEQLLTTGSWQGAATVSSGSFDKLPAPVARYFRMALRKGQPLVRSARIVHRGEFLTNPGNNGWSPFTSTQNFSVNPPGFVWDASIRFAPLMDVRVRDSYLSGRGAMEATTLAIVPVMNQRDKAELNEGALQRYFAEAVWFPTALLPESGVVWRAIDDSRALATLGDSGVKVSLEFSFNAKGEITRIFSAGRYREAGGKYELTPWVVQVSAYEERGGMRIPIEGEVSWQLPEGLQPYWKGRIMDVQYDFVR
jgi:hypothetical protein